MVMWKQKIGGGYKVKTQDTPHWTKKERYMKLGGKDLMDTWMIWYGLYNNIVVVGKN